MGLADELLAERTDDRLVALLGRVDRAAGLVRHREQGERREVDPSEVVGDPRGHLPVREVAIHLVAGGRDRGGLGRRGRGLVLPALGGAARTGRRVVGRSAPWPEQPAEHQPGDERHDDEPAEHGQDPRAPGHRARVGDLAESVKRGRLDPLAGRTTMRVRDRRATDGGRR